MNAVDLMAHSRRARFLSICLAACALVGLFSSGCAHQTIITTSTPGAEVYVEGERVGTTPLEYSTATSHQGEVFMDVRQDGVSRRFGVERDQVDGLALSAALASGVGLFGAGTVGVFASALLSVFAVAVIPVNPEAGLLFIGGSAVAFLVATALMGSAFSVPIFLFGETGYALPDRIDVDWVSGEVLTDGGSKVRDLVGVREGLKPHPQTIPDVGSERGYE